MKALLLGLIFVAFVSCKINRHNKIDDIKSSREANGFLRDLLGRQSKGLYVSDKLSYKEEEYRNLVSKVKAVPWVKADFDNNGYSDLLIVADDTISYPPPDSHYIACIMDSGENKYCVKRLSNFADSPALATFKIIDGLPSIIHYHFYDIEIPYVDNHGNKMPHRELIDTLIYKFDGFIEYCNSPPKLNIQKIEFQAFPCFGMSPSFKISINDKGDAEYLAKYNNKDKFGKEIKGALHTTINQSNFNEINNLLEYIDFPKLKPQYAVGWIEDQTCVTEITYDDGKTARVVDYGLQGTSGLKQLYRKLSALRLNQNWQ